MFSKIIKDLNQRIDDLVKTCKQQAELVDMWKEIANRKDLETKEYEYREKLWEKDKKELNNIIFNLMEKLNKSNVKNIRQARKIETLDNDDNVSI